MWNHTDNNIKDQKYKLHIRYIGLENMKESMSTQKLTKHKKTREFEILKC